MKTLWTKTSDGKVVLLLDGHLVAWYWDKDWSKTPKVIPCYIYDRKCTVICEHRAIELEVVKRTTSILAKLTNYL